MNSITIVNRAGRLLQYPQSFSLNDLEDLGDFLSRRGTCSMRDRDVHPEKIAVRHDVDHSIEHAAKFAEWEFRNGFQSTYFLLHSAGYWMNDYARTMETAQYIADMGHEIGIHNDAISESYIVQPGGGSLSLACRILQESIGELRDDGFNVVGCADHGGVHNNTAMWIECDLSSFGLEYEAYQAHRTANYISDNRGTWRAPLEHVPSKQTHVLIHPCHWRLP